MPVTVESLLEENVDKMVEFMQSLDNLRQLMMVEETDEFFVSAEKTYKQATDKMWSAKEILGVLDQAFENSEQQIDAKLKQLEEQCDSIEEKVQTIEKSTGQVFADLDAGAAKLDTVLEEKALTAQTELKTIQVAAAKLKVLIDAKAGDLQESTEKYTKKADEAFQNLVTRRTNTVSSLDTFTSKGAELVDGGKKTMDAVLADFTQQFEAVHAAYADKIETQIEQAAAEEEAKVKDQVQGAIEEATEQVQASNQHVKEAKNDIETEAAEVEKQADQAAESMGEAESSMENIKQSM